MGLPTNFPDIISKTLASGDKAAAARLAGQLEAALSDGSAWGFEDDLRKLQAAAGLPLSKAARAAERLLNKAADKPLRGDLQARFHTTMGMAKIADTPAERRAASEDVDRLTKDIATDALLRKALNEPKQMGLAPR